MKIAIIVNQPPFERQAAGSALAFARAAVDEGHEITRVFFYRGGTLIASATTVTPQNEEDWGQRWREFAERQSIELVVCVAAAMRRGVLDDGDARRFDKPASNCVDGYAVAGLGQLMDAMIEADRVVTFN